MEWRHSSGSMRSLVRLQGREGLECTRFISFAGVGTFLRARACEADARVIRNRTLSPRSHRLSIYKITRSERTREKSSSSRAQRLNRTLP